MPRQGGVDYAVHKELDHTLISIGYQRNLHDIRSRQTLQVGRTTHFIQELLLTPPLFKRTPRPTPPTLPRTVWDDVDLAGATMAALLDSLQQRMRMLPTHVHVYSRVIWSRPHTRRQSCILTSTWMAHTHHRGAIMITKSFQPDGALLSHATSLSTWGFRLNTWA